MPAGQTSGTKIATCCYCGTRAALVLKTAGRHELACSACGAPLHDLKAVKTETKRAGAKKKKRRDYGISHREPPSRDLHRKKHSKKRKKSEFWRFLEEAADVVEDIFD